MMASWTWLTNPPAPYRGAFVVRVLLKAALLFVLANVLFALADPLPLLGRLSVYHTFVPPRVRLPYGENPQESYNLSLTSLDAMLASHAVSAPKPSNEFRVLLLGDSSTWGFLLRPENTVAAYLNADELRAPDGRRVRVYNLGYPEMSLMKDLLLLDAAMRFQPDLIVWVFTMESFARDNQLEPLVVRDNPARARELIETYEIVLDTSDLPDATLWERTLIGRRRELADWLRLQLYGFTWAATGIDQQYPASFELRASDFEDDATWHTFDSPQTLTRDALAFDVLAAGVERAGDVPVILVNEPMFISGGRNSDVRYNFFYPRWAYDQYRTLLSELAAERGWRLIDLWDQIAPDEFTDSPVHLTPDGSRQLADRIALSIVGE